MATTTDATQTAKYRALAVVRDRYSQLGAVMGLALDISCGYPDSIGSPGYGLLHCVVRDTLDAIEHDDTLTDPSQLDTWISDTSAHEIADSAPSVYTHALWSEFGDLAGHREDVTDLLGGDMPDDLDTIAGVALYLIARRAVQAVAREVADAWDTDDEPDDTDDDAA